MKLKSNSDLMFLTKYLLLINSVRKAEEMNQEHYISLASKLGYEKMQKGEIIYSEDSYQTKIYIILRGKVKQEIKENNTENEEENEEEKSSLPEIFSKGEVIGEQIIISNKQMLSKLAKPMSNA